MFTIPVVYHPHGSSMWVSLNKGLPRFIWILIVSFLEKKDANCHLFNPCFCKNFTQIGQMLVLCMNPFFCDYFFMSIIINLYRSLKWSFFVYQLMVWLIRLVQSKCLLLKRLIYAPYLKHVKLIKNDVATCLFLTSKCSNCDAWNY